MVKRAARELLDKIIDNVFGYGRLDAPLWFVGYEEHCDDEKDAERRLPAMATFSGAYDVLEAHELMRHPNPVNTSVWPEMREIARAAGLRDAQVGSAASDVFLVEPLPLPHANEDAWYGELYAELGYEGRAKYVADVLPKRLKKLRQLINKHAPKVVVVHHDIPRKLLRELMGGEPRRIKIGADEGKRRGKVLLVRREGDTVWLKCANLSGNARWTAAERKNLREAVRAALALERKPVQAA
jgi:hypothetical protein